MEGNYKSLQNHRNIKGIKLTRNSGKDEAILAALSNLNSLMIMQ